MTRFIEILDDAGKTVLVNTDHIMTISEGDAENPGIVIKIPGEDVLSRTTLEEIKKQLSDDTPERIASNLFHIWEILRARLH